MLLVIKAIKGTITIVARLSASTTFKSLVYSFLPLNTLRMVLVNENATKDKKYNLIYIELSNFCVLYRMAKGND